MPDNSKEGAMELQAMLMPETPETMVDDLDEPKQDQEKTTLQIEDEANTSSCCSRYVDK